MNRRFNSVGMIVCALGGAAAVSACTASDTPSVPTPTTGVTGRPTGTAAGSSEPGLTPSAGSTGRITALPSMPGPEPQGTRLLERNGVGSTVIALTGGDRGKVVTFRFRCESGSFAIESKGSRFVWGGCVANGYAAATLERSRIDVKAIRITVAQEVSWALDVWLT